MQYINALLDNLKNANRVQKIIFTCWIIIFTITLFLFQDYELSSVLVVIVFISVVSYILYKVWGNKDN